MIIEIIKNNLNKFNFFNKYNNVCFSDLFVWRTDGFETKLYTDNILSLFYPSNNYKTKILVNIYTKNFNLIKKKFFNLKKYQNITYIFNEDEFGKDYGFFEIFHLIEKNPEKLNFLDSSTVGYRLKGQKNFSHIHRNHNFSSINCDKNFENPFKIIAHENIVSAYNPQFMFDDAEKIEISLKNESKSDANFHIDYFNKNFEKIQNDKINIQKNSLFIYALKIKSRFIRISSNLELLNKNDPNGSSGIINRPIVFKYFKNNFDVLHA